MAERRTPKPGKLVKMHPFWIQPELLDRLRAAQEALGASVGVKQSQSEMLRAAISLGLDAFERKLSRARP
jgi:hypothetical protein